MKVTVSQCVCLVLYNLLRICEPPLIPLPQVPQMLDPAKAERCECAAIPVSSPQGLLSVETWAVGKVISDLGWGLRGRVVYLIVSSHRGAHLAVSRKRFI